MYPVLTGYIFNSTDMSIHRWAFEPLLWHPSLYGKDSQFGLFSVFARQAHIDHSEYEEPLVTNLGY